MPAARSASCRRPRAPARLMRSVQQLGEAAGLDSARRCCATTTARRSSAGRPPSSAADGVAGRPTTRRSRSSSYDVSATFRYSLSCRVELLVASPRTGVNRIDSLRPSARTPNVIEALVEEPVHAVLQRAVEVDHHVAAEDHVELVERAVRDEVVLREDDVARRACAGTARRRTSRGSTRRTPACRRRGCSSPCTPASCRAGRCRPARCSSTDSLMSVA